MIKVIKDGKVVAEDGNLIVRLPSPIARSDHNSMKIGKIRSAVVRD